MRRISPFLTSALVLSNTTSYAQPGKTELRALGVMYSLTVMGGLNRDWCLARTPQSRTVVQNGYDAWLEDTKLDVINQKAQAAFGSGLAKLRETVEGTRQQLYATLDGTYPNPAQACQNFRAIMTSEMHPQKVYPAEYAAALKVQVTPAQVTTNNVAKPATSAVSAAGKDANGAYDLPAGTKLGGPLTPGTYACRVVRTSNNEVRQYTLNLYPNREWRKLIDGREIDTATYKYDSQSGQFEIYSLELHNPDDEDDFAIFYTSNQGKPTIYGESSYGLGIYETTCLYAGPNKLPSPQEASVQKQKKDAADAAARAEANRFKWVTAPGKGVPLNQIQAILFTSELKTTNGYSLNEDWVLLLKDGWAYTGLRVSPHDLDVRKSRQNEPAKWIKWRKQGGKYQSLNPRTGKWEGMEGSPVLPAAKNERISGLFQNYSTYSAGDWDGAYKSATTLSVNFGKDGAFSTSSYDIGGVGSGDTSSTSVNTANQGGCTSTTSTTARAGNSQISGQNPTVLAGGSSSTGCNKNSFTATYTLDGYTIQRRYPDGTVTRQLFFFRDARKDRVFVGSMSYMRK